MTWEDFVSNVQQWARERGIYEHSTPDAQLLKALSEVGELADAYIKKDNLAIRDGIGDVLVCLINYQSMSNGATNIPVASTQSISTWGHSNPAVLIGHLAFSVGSYIGRESDGELLPYIITGTEFLCHRLDINFAHCYELAWTS